MSADNWTICPQCKVNAEKARDDALNNLGKSYGKVSETEYNLLKERTPSGEVNKTTLREDYETWTDEDGEYHHRYSCSCSVCGFKFEKKEDRVILKV